MNPPPIAPRPPGCPAAPRWVRWGLVAGVAVAGLSLAAGAAGFEFSRPLAPEGNIPHLSARLQFLVTGNLLVAALVIGARAWVVSRWPAERGLLSQMVGAGVASAGCVALGVLQPLVRWGGDEVLALILFIALPTLLLLVPALCLAATWLRSPARVGWLLAGFVLASAAGQSLAVSGPGIGAEERAILVNSSLAALAIFTALGIWSAGSPVEAAP